MDTELFAQYSNYAVYLCIFLFSLLKARAGLVNNTSWFAAATAFGMFTSGFFAFPFALSGHEEFSWLLRYEYYTKYQTLVNLTLIVGWVTHYLVLNDIETKTKAFVLPPIRIDLRRTYSITMVLSSGGSIFTIVFALSGYLGYFISREVLMDPPGWIGIASAILQLTFGLYIVSVMLSYRLYGRLSLLAIIAMILWMLSGAFTGFKYQIIFPVVIVIISSWIYREPRLWHAGLLLTAIFIAYTVVEPLRDIHLESDNIVGTLFTKDNLDRVLEVPRDPVSIAERTALRMDYSPVAVWTLTVHQMHGLPFFVEKLKETYYLIPALAFVPRFLWEGKPLANTGQVLYNELTGAEGSSITPLGVVSTYMLFGYGGVVVVASLYAVFLTLAGSLMQRYIWNVAHYFPIILFALFLSVGNSYFSFFLIDLIRYSAMLLIFYLVCRAFGLTEARHNTSEG